MKGRTVSSELGIGVALYGTPGDIGMVLLFVAGRKLPV
jgi:hypothetical protein